ncbi:hypothetical protein Tco_0429467 [Tanacetum coccineum]
MNITSPSSSLDQINFILEDWGTSPGDSSIEFNFCTYSVAMEANGSGFFWLLGVDCDALIELWMGVEHCGSLVGTVVEGTVQDYTVVLEPVRYTTYLLFHRYARMHIQQRLVRDLPCNTECRGDHFRSHTRIDMVIKNLDLEPKIYAMMRDFLEVFAVLPGGKN